MNTYGDFSNLVESIRDTLNESVEVAKVNDGGNTFFMKVNKETGVIFATNERGSNVSPSNFTYMMNSRQSASELGKYLKDQITKRVVNGNEPLHKVLTDITKMKWVSE